MALARTGFKRKVFERTKPSAPCPLVRRVSMTGALHTIAPMPKQPRHADRHLLDMARGQACLLQSPLCNHDAATVVACHGAGVALGKGMGYKVGDQLIVHGCSDCNHFTDAYGGATPAEKQAVFDAGHARQVAWWQELAASPGAKMRDKTSARVALSLLNLNDLT